MHEGSLLSTSSPALAVCWFIGDNHSDRHEVISRCGFDGLFFGVTLSIFSYVIALLMGAGFGVERDDYHIIR